jgi:hypothetical protein
VGEGGYDFGSGGFADLAVAVVDAALRESVLAAAVAGFGIEFVQRGNFLFGRELGKIDAGKFAGAVGVLQKYLTSVFEGFHFDVSDRQAKERTDFRFVEKRIAQTLMFLNDAAFGVKDERSGKRGDVPVLQANVVAGNGHGIIDAKFGDEIFDGALIVVVHDESENLEAIFVFVLELDEVWDFSAARSAPGGPKIQKDDFAVGIGECDGLSIETCELEVRRSIGVAYEANGGLVVLAGRRGRKETRK